MMYNYIKLADDTQIAHSNILEDQTVQVSIERPVDGGFCSATCFLPQCRWQSVEGFNASELEYFTEIVRSNAPLIYRLAREAGKAICLECSSLVPTSSFSG